MPSTWASRIDWIVRNFHGGNYREGLGMSRVWIPEVGWTACELMARRGVPNRINHQASGRSRGATWWYGSGSNLTMVSLELSGSTWRVRYVGRE